MRLVSFHREGRLRLGALVALEERPPGGPAARTGEPDGAAAVVDLGRVDPALDLGMRDLLEAGDRSLAAAARALEDPSPEAVLPLRDVRLGPVLADPRKILCIGLNYRDHAKETGQAIPEVPTVFAKYPNVLIGHGAPIVIPRATSEVDYEAELAFVIGRRGRAIREADAMEHVAGYAIFNDVTARDVQRRTPQWTLGKSFDTFGPFGPALVTRDEVPDPHALAIRLAVDGEVLQDSTTSAMVFSVARLVAYLSEGMTLEPGDVVTTGTPAGVGFVRRPPRFLRPGETVRVEIEGLGALENPVVAGG